MNDEGGGFLSIDVRGVKENVHHTTKYLYCTRHITSSFYIQTSYLKIIVVLLFVALAAKAQYNTDRVIISGQIAFNNQDYVVAIQHFNNVLSGKPYLYEPWYYRGLAKLMLEDYAGAEEDFTEAIKLNPYVHQIFSARAESYIRLNKYEEAINDYEKALALSPDERGYWYNRAYCRFFLKEYQQIHEELDYIVKRWPDLNNAYSLQTEVYLNENDTATASRWLDKTLEHNPYDGSSWSIKGRLSLQRKEWGIADSAFTKAIHYQPRVVNNYMYRAMARVNLNKLRQAMEDYDKAIDMNPNNFLSHYNRGLLRQQLGDDNRAIEDFNFVLTYEPNNILALYNRAILLDKTGDYRAAIADYSRVIETFPNFWTGLINRAACYRKLGMVAKAEMDEFRVTKAQMDKRLGIQQRWSPNKLREVRKMSDVDVEKYDQWVVVDEDIVTPDYKNEYRGSIQNRMVENVFMPLFSLSLMPYVGGVRTAQLIDHDLEKFNNDKHPLRKLYVTCKPAPISEDMTKSFFLSIDSLTKAIAATHDIQSAADLLLQRAVTHATTHNFTEAINDLNDYIHIDSTDLLAFWERAYCHIMINESGASQGVEEIKLRNAAAQSDMEKALSLNENNAFLYYDIATIYAQQKEYNKAIDLYQKAIQLNGNLAEAYYNLGLVRIFNNSKAQGIKDLSKAGELGLYDAYSIIKRYSSDKSSATE
ncbi:MAG: tetratricopeptide repeat protein [Prevotella sp.]|nr:tetratricopeptide repeat protein [Prevotella sp.]